ncbi:hypothetical protein KC318_g4248 [Hortaea werneckii]|nr:hypothetical protein KC334_g11280 [Hortaea werneckii]KAI7015443.1 hypothetical protein KC355_g4320 [Hortaea werneckii]KAI7670081.1 hypothetical protein KC318_g4248 [Hortaea werneckii]
MIPLAHTLLLLVLPLLLLVLPLLLSPLVEGRPDITTITTIATTFTTLYRPQIPSPTPPLNTDDQTPSSENLARALTAANLLLPREGNDWYNATTGLWQDLWWNSGNIVTTLARLGQIIDEGEETEERGEEAKEWRDSVIGFLEEEFGAAERGTGEGQGWTRGFFDDGGWWALAWIQVYDLTNDPRYLTAAEEIFEDLTTGFNATCGGQWWDKAHTASNTINNALYISVAAHLANRVSTTSSSSSKDPEACRTTARTHLHWLQDQNLLTPNGTYVDGLDLQTCQPTGPVFTYNQGVMIGALVEMSRFPSSSSASSSSESSDEGASQLLDKAETLATGALQTLVDKEGILTETAFLLSHPNLDLVSAQFKGIFVRNLAELYSVRPREEFREFVRRNAQSIWERDRISGGENEGLLGAAWQGPGDASVSSAAQGSGLDCLVAAVGVGA